MILLSDSSRRPWAAPRRLVCTKLSCSKKNIFLSTILDEEFIYFKKMSIFLRMMQKNEKFVQNSAVQKKNKKLWYSTILNLDSYCLKNKNKINCFANDAREGTICTKWSRSKHLNFSRILKRVSYFLKKL